MRSEDGIALAYRALEIKHVGFQRTLDRVIFELGDDRESRPRLLIFRDPAPALLVFRRPGTNGTVLISQGMIPLLNETELRCLVQYAVKRCRDQGITLSTFCSYLSVLIFKWAPLGWARLMFTEGRIVLPSSDTNLGVFTAFRFSMVYFAIRFLSWLGHPPRLIRAEDPVALAAVQKINQTLQIWGPAQVRGAFGSFLTMPVAFNSLVNPCRQE